MTSSTKQLIVFVLIVAGVVWFFRSGSGGGSFDGEAPPALEAAGFLNAEAMPTLAGAKGSKVVLVEFWATWCPPCRKSVPHLNELHKTYEEDGLLVIGVSDEDEGTVRRFVDSMPMEYPVLYGSTSGRAYGVKGIPHAFLVGRSGNVLWSGHPMNPAMQEALEEALAAGS